MFTRLAVAALLFALPLVAADALYPALQPDQFMKKWLVLKPIPAGGSEAAQKQAFAADQLAVTGLQPRAGAKVALEGQSFEWTLVESPEDEINLIAGKRPSNFSIAYAWADVEMAANTKAMLGIGSDDGVKVWLNGKLVHNHWAARGVESDDDAVPVEFVRGRNQLLLKIQNIEGDWGFSCRIMGPQSRGNKLVSEALRGDDQEAAQDSIKRLLDTGMVEVNGLNDAGLSAVHAARLKGNSELEAYLVSRGADLKIGVPAPEKILDAEISSRMEKGQPGIAVLVAQNGKILFQKGYGFADVERKIPVTTQTKFRIGSITKQFTASAILKLQEDGKLSVTDKLSKYIPDFPRGDEVTITELLRHTSGIHSYTDDPSFYDSVAKPITLVDLIKTFKNHPYDFEPGKKWHYDNSGYVLLAYIVEKVSGMPYTEYMRKTLLAPAGMNESGFHRSTLSLTNEAVGYKYDGDNTFSRPVNWDMSQAPGDGDIYSTVGDLFRWNEAVFNGKVLSDASLKAAFTPVNMTGPTEPNAPDGYGFGWGIGRLRGAQLITHSGGLPGWSSLISRLPREKFTVVVLANALPGAPDLETGMIGHDAAEFFLGEQLAPRSVNKTNPAISSKSFDAIAGRYSYPGAVMEVTTANGHLYAQLTGQPRFEIFPKSETEFFWKVVNAQVEFVKDDSGKVVKAIHHQNGSTFSAPRMEEVKVVAVQPADLDAIVGKYEYAKGKAVLTVTREGDHLFAQMTGQDKFEIYPKSATEFFWKVVDAQVTFVKDANGKVIQAVHHQGGATIEAPRIE